MVVELATLLRPSCTCDPSPRKCRTCKTLSSSRSKGPSYIMNTAIHLPCFANCRGCPALLYWDWLFRFWVYHDTPSHW